MGIQVELIPARLTSAGTVCTGVFYELYYSSPTMTVSPPTMTVSEFFTIFCVCAKNSWACGSPVLDS